MTNNQNKGEKKCECGHQGYMHQIVDGRCAICIECPFNHTPQSVEKESEGKKYTMMAQRGSGKTYVKKIMDKMFNQIQDNAELTNYPKKPFIPQSNTLGTTMEERFDKQFVESHIWNEYPIFYSVPFEDIQPIKNFINEEITQSKAETIKECRKLIEKEINLETLESDDAITDVCRQARNHMAEKLLKETLLSKDIEQ